MNIFKFSWNLIFFLEIQNFFYIFYYLFYYFLFYKLLNFSWFFTILFILQKSIFILINHFSALTLDHHKFQHIQNKRNFVSKKFERNLIFYPIFVYKIFLGFPGFFLVTIYYFYFSTNFYLFIFSIFLTAVYDFW